MCGHAGYIGNNAAELALAKRLLIACSTRGKHATGYLEIGGDGRYTLRKQAVPASTFVEGMQFEFKGPNHTFLGHVRFATTGDKKSTVQAHPFVGNRFILFHNGSIQPYDEKRLGEKFNIRAENGVDSELFLAFLEQSGSVDALRDQFLPELSEASAYALVIFDKVTKSVHFLRCNGRPLAYLKTGSGSVFYASTAAILQKAMGKAHCNIELLQPYTHIEIASFSGDILRKCVIGVAKSLNYSDAAAFIKSTGKPIRFL